MRFALRLARRRGLGGDEAARLETLLDRLALPALPAIASAPLLDAMRRDKKARETGLVWVLPRALGDGRMVSDVSWAEVEGELTAFLTAGVAV
jgi:3-dehydroquinate synthetase